LVVKKVNGDAATKCKNQTDVIHGIEYSNRMVTMGHKSALKNRKKNLYQGSNHGLHTSYPVFSYLAAVIWAVWLK